MSDASRLLCFAALLVAGLLAAWTAWACLWPRQGELSGPDMVAWAGLATVLLIYSIAKVVRYLGLLKGLGGRLRMLAKQYRLYADRHGFQVLASITIGLVVAVLLTCGLLWMWHTSERYRLAIGFASLLVGFGAIRFISLHEFDAWNAAMPWVLPMVELMAAGGVSAVALVRLYELGELARLWR